MSIEPTRDEGQRLPSPSGRVIGAVDTKAELDEAESALRTAGFEKNEVLYGPDGIELMKRLRGVFFLGDEEASVIERNIAELEQGHYIIAIHASSGGAKQAAEIAASHGVRSLTHFGMWVNTRLT
jgi:hypothetical protein